jgi:glutaminyl-peptide cyclotransferase
VASYPHDPNAFTEGLLYDQGHLYESTGLEGASSLRLMEADSGHVLQQANIAAPLFGEGLASVGNVLIQLTWKDGRAIVWDRDTFRPLQEHQYAGEGWGLCFDGLRLVMSDGSDRLTFREATTFTRIGEVAVTSAGEPVRELNELECVGGLVYANVWHRDEIARIDAQSGDVIAWIDASGLLPPEVRARVDVLNGIAYVPERRTFLLTGKYWPRTFEVQFVPRGTAGR